MSIEESVLSAMEEALRGSPAVERALALATAAHEGMTRNEAAARNGAAVGLPADPYILHPTRVAYAALNLGMSTAAVTAALLHDVVEDTDVTLADLQAAGVSPFALELVDLLTKRTWRRGAAYYDRIQGNPTAASLKLLDRADNLHDMTRVVGTHLKWAQRYLRKTAQEFPPLVAVAGHSGAVRLFAVAVLALQAAVADVDN